MISPLNYTCRYCQHCDMLIGHKDELEHLLTAMFAQYDPSIIGNDYLIVGAVEKKAWREGLTQPKSVAEMLPQTHDFKSYQEIRMTMGGGSAPTRSRRLCLLLPRRSGLNVSNLPIS